MTRALVLGSGGSLGVGWESGFVVGLAEGGVDLGAADAIFGTSAGSFVGAELALGVDLTDYAAQLSGLRAAVLAESAAWHSYRRARPSRVRHQRGLSAPLAAWPLSRRWRARRSSSAFSPFSKAGASGPRGSIAPQSTRPLVN